ncbi:MAG: riboflavin biosynthesis protein RibF [Acidobacteriaceae bacterium]|nr:riboflavin biosynthesis protein RibF [Acidobacteriaceae bacterium]
MRDVKVFRSAAEAREHFAPAVVAIGNFDGVHVGHRALLRAAAERAAADGFVPSVLTFDPHPATVVAPERKPEMVCSLDERLRLLGQAGASQILVLPFTLELSRLSPEEFVSAILVNSMKTRAVMVGDGFRFGYRQAGDINTLRDLGRRFGFVSQFLKPVVVRGEVVSSSAVRRHIAAGNVARAGRLLGRCFSVIGPVVQGHGVGSKQTVPTLNVRPVPDQVLPRGVFVTETFEHGAQRRWPSITNVGVRPTFGGDELTIETYLLSPLNTQTPEAIEVDFRHFVRVERKFVSPEELKAQIVRDVRAAQTYWRRVQRFVGTEASIY